MVRAASAAAESLAATRVACPGSSTARLIFEVAKTSALLRVVLALEERGLVPRSTRLLLGLARSYALIVLGEPLCNETLNPTISIFHL
jgi:hypothetical protein